MFIYIITERSPKLIQNLSLINCSALSRETLPGGHDNNKYHLFPHHAPEVSEGFW